MGNILKHYLNFNKTQYPHQRWIRGITIAVVILFSASRFIVFINLGVLGFIIALVLSLIAALICFVISALIETVLTKKADNKTHLKDTDELKESGFADLEDIEKMRYNIQRMNKNMILIFILMNVVFFIVLALSFIKIQSIALGWIIAIVSMIPFIIALVSIYKKKSPLDTAYKESFEKSVVNKTLESAFNIKEFERNKSFDLKIINDSQIFPYYENYIGEDFLSAKHNNTHFEQADVRLTKEEEQHYTDSKGDSRIRMVTVNVFTGKLMVVDYDAISNEPVFVHDKRIKSVKTIVETEMQEFNDRFSIEADSPQSAFRILTPQVLEGIVNASNKLNCPISMAFKDDKIYIAVGSGDSFAVTNMRGETLIQQKERIKNDVQIIIDLIDSIYLK